MKLLATALAIVGLFLFFASNMGGAGSPQCPQIPQGSITLPDSHAADLALLLNAADVLNNSGTCVRDGGWSDASGAFYFTVREPGAKHEVRRYSGDALRSLSSLGQRQP